MISLTIDGKQVEAREGMTVLEAARSADIYIPTLCYDPDLEPYGACRLCIVEVEKMRGFPTACTTPATDGMVVNTNTPALNEIRRATVQLLLADHPSECLICDRRERCQPFDICLRNVAVTERCVNCPKNGQCELQEVVDYIGIKEVTLPYTYKELPMDTEMDSRMLKWDFLHSRHEKALYQITNQKDLMPRDVRLLKLHAN